MKKERKRRSRDTKVLRVRRLGCADSRTFQLAADATCWIIVDSGTSYLDGGQRTVSIDFRSDWSF